MSLRLACSVWAIVALARPAAAQAPAEPAEPIESLLASARAGLEAADFGAVDLALDRAARASMTREQLLTWLELRALVAYADERFGALDEALAGLVSIAHEGEAPASFPRSVRARYEELRARGVRVELGAELATSRSSDANERGFGVVAVVADDPGHLVRRTRVRARAAGGEWRELTPSDRIALPGDRARDADVEYVVEGLGPGGSVIATYGTEERPIEAVVEGIPPDETPMIVGLVVGGAAIVAGIVVTLAAAIATDGFRDGMTTVIGPTSAGVPLIRF